jgi:RNA polymerase sigma-70 factor (ECF subfamily)
MRTTPPPDSDDLLTRACGGDDVALGQLLERYRDRLRQMVEFRMDPRLSTRVDASDVVQDAIAEATRRMSDYSRQRPMPFYPWLRRLAWQRLMDLYRRHVQAEKRSVLREQELDAFLPDESAMQLADCLAMSGSSPSRQSIRKEQRNRVQEALSRMNPHDRDLLVMVYLEQMSISDVSVVLGISEKATEMRHLRALERLRRVLAEGED